MNKSLQGDILEASAEKKRKEDWDKYTRGPDSMHIRAAQVWGPDGQATTNLNPYESRHSGKGDVFDPDYDRALLAKARREEKPLSVEQLSKEDKMTFFLLKWVFNSIKHDYGGEAIVEKRELVEQLQENPDIVVALGFESAKEVQLEVGRYSESQSLSWAQFLDFFFSRGGGKDEWWKRVDAGEGNSLTTKKKIESSGRASQTAVPANEKRFGSSKTYNPTSHSIGGGRSYGQEQNSRAGARNSSPPGYRRSILDEDGAVLLTEEADLEREEEKAVS